MADAQQQQAATAAHHADPRLVIAALGFVTLIAAISLGWSLLLRATSRRRLRLCPVCCADAVRTARADALDITRVRARLQCGQCGTWRRVLTSYDELDWHARSVGHDRRLIGDRAHALAARRKHLDFNAFMLALRSEIVGADDFLARTRHTTPVGRRRHARDE